MEVPLTVNDFLDRAVLVYGTRVGVVDEPDQPAASWGDLTWERVGEVARAQAAGLDALGIGQGEAVAIVSQNSARLLTSFFGVSGWGRTLVPINFRLTAEEVGYIVEHSRASALLVEPELDDALSTITVRHRFVLGRDTDEELFRFDVEPRPWGAPDESATATINYTSGTTARPKGVQLTHRNIWLNATVLAMHLQMSDREVYLHTLPMFHCNGWGVVYGVTGLGGRHIVLRKVDGAEILRRVERHGVTMLCGAPTVLSTVLDAAASWDGETPGRGRVRVAVGGAPPPTRVIERVETELGWEFNQIYGLTETTPILTANRPRQEWDDLTPTERATKLARAGAPVLGVRLRVDQQGEVEARGNNVMAGYWEQPQATAEAIPDGWFRTGDGGAIHDDCYLSILDRKKDVIVSGGENVSSVEVEDRLFSHPDVLEVAVIGVPHEKWGETVKALVVLAPGATATEEELIAHCKSHLAGFKCPTSVDFRESLARTATGKLQKFKLREPYWSTQECS